MGANTCAWVTCPTGGTGCWCHTAEERHPATLRPKSVRHWRTVSGRAGGEQHCTNCVCQQTVCVIAMRLVLRRDIYSSDPKVLQPKRQDTKHLCSPHKVGSRRKTSRVSFFCIRMAMLKPVEVAEMAVGPTIDQTGVRLLTGPQGADEYSGQKFWATHHS